MSWPQQPLAEKVQKLNMIFDDSTQKNFFSKHKNKAEFKCQYDSEVLKAMKSSPLLRPFCVSEFWGFSLLNI